MLTDRDLIDLLQAVHILNQGLQALGKDLPPESAEHLATCHQGVEASIANIVARRCDPHSPEFTDVEEGLTFTREFPFMLYDDSVSFEEARKFR